MGAGCDITGNGTESPLMVDARKVMMESQKQQVMEEGKKHLQEHMDDGDLKGKKVVGNEDIKKRIPKRFMSFDNPNELPFKSPRISGILRPPRRKYVIVQALPAPNRRPMEDIIPEMEELMTDYEAKLKGWVEDFESKSRGWVEDQKKMMRIKMEEFKELKNEIEKKRREAGLEQPQPEE